MSVCFRGAQKKPGMQEPHVITVIVDAPRDCCVLPFLVYVCDYECLCVRVHVYSFIMYCLISHST